MSQFPPSICFALGRHAHRGSGIWVYGCAILQALVDRGVPEDLEFTITSSSSVLFRSEVEKIIAPAGGRISLQWRGARVGLLRLGHLFDFMAGFSTAKRFSLYHGAANTVPLFVRGATAVTVHDLLQPFPVDGPSTVYEYLRCSYYRIQYRNLFRRVQLVITGHEDTREQIISRYEPMAKVEVLYPPLATEFQRSELVNYAEDGLHFLAFASPDRRKNVVRLLQAVAAFLAPQAPKKNSFRLTVVGNNSDTASSVQRTVQQLGLDSVVSIEVAVANHELLGLFKRSKAVLFPSLGEGFGYPVYEALSQGRFALCSEGMLVGKLKHLAGEAVMECNPRSVSSIQEGIRQLVDRPCDVGRMSAVAREVRAVLDPDAYVQRLVGLYREMLEEM